MSLVQFVHIIDNLIPNLQIKASYRQERIRYVKFTCSMPAGVTICSTTTTIQQCLLILYIRQTGICWLHCIETKTTKK